MSEALRASPLEIAGIIAFTAVLVGLAAVFGIKHRRATTEAERSRAEALMSRVTADRLLSPSQVETLRRLHSYQRRPAHLRRLIEESATFERVADRAISDQVSSAAAITALRVQLGHRAERDGAPTRSTAGIPEGAEVSLRVRGREYKAVVGQVLTSGLQVNLDQAGSSGGSGGTIPEGRSVILKHFSGAGLYQWNSAVIHASGADILLSHSRNPVRTQRRAWYRRSLTGAVLLLDPEGETRAEGTLVDLSGGGAAISGFGNLEEDRVRLALPEYGITALAAEVLRRSDGTLHVRFTDLREADRDRLVRAAFHGSRAEVDGSAN